MQKFYFIRGKRILNQLALTVNETTVPELQRNLSKFPTKKRQFATDPIQVTQIQMIPLTPSNSLQIKALTASDGKKYDTVIIFDNVDYSDSESPDFVTINGADNAEYHVSEIDLNRSNVKVRCECLDFHWRFALANSKDQSLYGSPPPPHQPKSNRGPVNPKDIPGVCKHILKTIDGLRQSGLIK